VAAFPSGEFTISKIQLTPSHVAKGKWL